MEEFKGLNIAELPHCFIHGDLITTNIVKDKAGLLWIIDFAVSNYYPRIQELAVLACNICFNRDDQEESRRKFSVALEEYQKVIPLTNKEKEALPTCVKLAHAMHIIGAIRVKIEDGDIAVENEYFLDQGRSGLRQMLSE